VCDTRVVERGEHVRSVRDSYDSLAPVWAESTDDNLWNEVLDRRPIRSLLPDDLTGRSVLDVGTAGGAIAAELVARGAEVTAIDLSPAMVDTARARCGGRGRFLVADVGEPLPFDDASFDGAVASMALHYIKDWTTPLASLARVLRPGGWLIVSTDHPDSPFSRSHRTKYLDTELVTDEWTKAGVTVEVSFWRQPLSRMLNAFADAGFCLDRVLEPDVDDNDRRRYPQDAAGVGAPIRIVVRWRNNPAA